MSTTVLTPKFRVSFPHIFKTSQNKLSGNDEYSVVALFDKSADLSKLKAAAEAAATDKWGSDKKKWPVKLRSPFRDQAEMRNKEGNIPPGCTPGDIFIRFKTKQRPGIVDQNREDIIDEKRIYAGCYGIAQVNAYAYDTPGNAGIAFGLNHFQFAGEGEPLSGRQKPQDVFAPIAMEEGSDATSIF